MSRLPLPFKTSLPSHELKLSEKADAQSRIIHFHFAREKKIQPSDLKTFYILKPSNAIISKAELRIISNDYFNLMNSYQKIANQYGYTVSQVRQIISALY